MKLAIVNGSPRGRKSNSDRIIGWLTQEADDAKKIYVADLKKQDESAKLIKDADSILFVFPLYTDAMPGLLKAFLEKLNKYDLSGKTAAFVVHSGFSEAVHSRMVEKYCAYFAKINKMNLLGTVVMGGSEALQVAPDNYFGKKLKAYKVLSGNLAKQETLDDKAVKIIAGSERFSKFMIFLLKILPTDFYWNGRLKKNGAFKKRFDKPYN